MIEGLGFRQKVQDCRSTCSHGSFRIRGTLFWGQGVFFFVVAPFCSCPASLVSRKFFAVGPGCAKCFFFVALRWAPRPFGGARAKKKNTTQLGVFFFAPAPGKGRGRRSPVPTRGQSKKKNTTQGVFFFAPAPAKGKGRRSPVGRRHGARAKKKTPPRVFFFCSGPGERQGKEKPRADTGPEQKKKHHPGCFFFCCGPGERQGKEKPRWAPARGQSKKKTPPRVCFFLLRPRGKAGEGEAPLGAGTGPEPEQKKNTLGGVFFFAAAPRGRSLTHCGPGWRCLPLAGVVFSFCCGPARTGVVFFFAVAPPGRSLTHCGLGRFRQGPGGVSFFLLRPRRVFLDNSKKCLGYYIGSKKTRRGHSKKKNTTSLILGPYNKDSTI